MDNVINIQKVVQVMEIIVLLLHHVLNIQIQLVVKLVLMDNVDG